MRSMIATSAMLFLSAGCSMTKETPPSYQTNNVQNYKSNDATIDKDGAIAIAKEDATKVYKSLDRYEIFALETKWTWRVIFELKADTEGGGPEYIISKQTGSILAKNYYQ
jgi:hypothetical protein